MRILSVDSDQQANDEKKIYDHMKHADTDENLNNDIIITLSSRLPEAVDLKNPMMCSFSRVAIGMKKIYFQDWRSDVEVKIDLLPFSTSRLERVKNSGTAKLWSSSILKYFVVFSSILR